MKQQCVVLLKAIVCIVGTPITTAAIVGAIDTFTRFSLFSLPILPCVLIMIALSIPISIILVKIFGMKRSINELFRSRSERRNNE